MVHWIMPLITTYHTLCGLKGELPYTPNGPVDCPECIEQLNRNEATWYKVPTRNVEEENK